MNLQHLQSRHKELSEKIVDAYQHYLSDNLITKLKKERLKIKTLIINFFPHYLWIKLCINPEN